MNCVASVETKRIRGSESQNSNFLTSWKGRDRTISARFPTSTCNERFLL